MSSFTCHCGEIISTTRYPNEIEGSIYGVAAQEVFEAEIEKAVSAFLALKNDERRAWLARFFSPVYLKADLTDASIVSDITTNVQTRYLRSVVECPMCARLYVQELPGQEKYRAYLPEVNSTPGILR